MKRKTNLPELLAPAGSPEALYAAVAAGADAVYLGGRAFHARAGAVNFDDEGIEAAVRYCHAFGVKVYVTLNTLLYDKELAAFLDHAAMLYRVGVDAVIVADRGAMRLLSTYLPGLPLHASTQASVHSVAGADDLLPLGVSRVVPARELPLSDIWYIVDNSKTEVEVFLHGALCVSYSGQCLFSSLVGGRSGNRGECAQPCRLPYNGRYPLSLRDLSLSAHIPALIESGVASLKIEGRMKSPGYVFGVTEIYRRLLDEGRAATGEEDRRLRELFSRGGFTDGYFVGKTSQSMTGIRREQDKQDTRALGELSLPARKVALSGQLFLHAGQKARLSAALPGKAPVTVEGDLPLPAQNAPLTQEALLARLGKTGGTPYVWGELSVDMEEGLFMSPASINGLRRAAFAALTAPSEERRSFAPLRDVAFRTPSRAGDEVGPTALCYTAKAADVLAEIGGFSAIFVPMEEYPKAKARPLGVYVPPVLHDREKPAVLATLRRCYAEGARLALAGNADLILALQDIGFTVYGDFRLNITNAVSAAYWQERGLKTAILSPELSLPGLRDIGWGSVVVYGRIPLMLTERCFQKENFGCEACNRSAFIDRRGARFPLLREYPHRTLVLNSLPTYIGDKPAALATLAALSPHFIFTVEGEREVREVVAAYRRGEALPYPVRRIAAAPGGKEKKA